jgi:hypothetical protein
VHDVLMGNEDGATAVASMEADLVDLTGFPTGTP